MLNTDYFDDKDSQGTLFKATEEEKLLSISETANFLSMSVATVQNWVKTNKIEKPKKIGRESFFNKSYVEEILEKIKSKENKQLKSRRNKNFVSGFLTPKKYVSNQKVVLEVEKIASQFNEIELTDFEQRLILAEYSLKLLIKRGLLEDNNEPIAILNFLNKKNLSSNARLITDLVGSNDIVDIEKKVLSLKKNLCHEISFVFGVDTLGLLYMSLQSCGKRKKNGVYYTPEKVVKKSVNSLNRNFNILNKKICDPCCGTGNFLIYAYQITNDVKNLFGFDIDEISVALARINMLLLSREKEIDFLYENIRVSDSLLAGSSKKFNIILGNPPWGFVFTNQQEKRLKNIYESATIKKVESFDLFIENGLKSVEKDGIVCLVVPESLLTVKSHILIREYIEKNAKIKNLIYWGNVFDGVQCPAITIFLQKDASEFSSKGIEVIRNEEIFEIKSDRKNRDKVWSFHITDEDYSLLEKIEKGTAVDYLKDRAEFALGIVTGDNKKFVKNNRDNNEEIILKGSELFKYEMRSKNQYIKFSPDLFQQVAPEKYYRANEKIIYRFISDSLIFVYDDKKTLTLNSANVVIPKTKDLLIKYILAVFNSQIMHFFYKLRFNSIKLLRNHIESFPIPRINLIEQEEIVNLVERIEKTKNHDEKLKIYYEIDKKIAQKFCLTMTDYARIKDFCSKSNLFI